MTAWWAGGRRGTCPRAAPTAQDMEHSGEDGLRAESARSVPWPPSVASGGRATVILRPLLPLLLKPHAARAPARTCWALHFLPCDLPLWLVLVCLQLPLRSSSLHIALAAACRTHRFGFASASWVQRAQKRTAVLSGSVRPQLGEGGLFLQPPGPSHTQSVLSSRRHGDPSSPFPLATRCSSRGAFCPTLPHGWSTSAAWPDESFWCSAWIRSPPQTQNLNRPPYY